jgi:hypothetical protein
MAVETAKSVRDIPIRLTDERWAHIEDEHGELSEFRHHVLDTISRPERVFSGPQGEKLAIKAVEAGKWMVVVYREFDADGFIITAFLTRRLRSLERRNQIWP